MWRRARGLGETYRLARRAAARAGVTRLADISGLGGIGLPVFQAVRPLARSLTLSQGKGRTPLAAKVSALLEACELAHAEVLPHPGAERPLAQMPAAVRRFWSGDRGPLTIDLDPARPRGWVEGCLLGSGRPMAMPWDLIALDFTRPPGEFPAGSEGLATGNTCAEAIMAALAELIEYDLVARFEALSPPARRALQIDARTITDPELAGELALVRSAGFEPRLWSLGQRHAIPAIACKLFAHEPALDRMTPTGGSACHPDPVTAALGALREAVQGRAALVAGARDDIVAEDYHEGPDRARSLIVATLAVAEGPLAWSDTPVLACDSAAQGTALLLKAVASLSSLPVAVFHHTPEDAELSIVHALAPGLLSLSRRRQATAAMLTAAQSAASHRARPTRTRKVLFAGPSVCGLPIPRDIELRAPAVCGDLAALLSDPPAAVGLVDGYFGTAPTVWHKEILDLLGRGVRVLGAASIGAVRAAELADMGMEGVGAIFAAYRAGAIERDDAVMLLQAPAGYGHAPLTVALVDAEYALNTVPCPPRARRMMQRIVRTMRYDRRSWPRCLAEYRSRAGTGFPVALEDLAAASSLKRADAALLIARLSEFGSDSASPPERGGPPMTNHYLRMLARTPGSGFPDPR